MIATIIIIGLAFTWLGYETNWMRVRLLAGGLVKPTPIPVTLKQWQTVFRPYRSLKELDFIAPMVYSHKPVKHTGYCVYRTSVKQHTYPEIYSIYLSPNTDALVSRQWLDKHWADLEDYHPTVELYFGNGYKQTFTLRKPKLMKQIIKINTGKKYFKHLVTLAP